MRLAFALTSLALSVWALTYVIISGRRIAKLNAQTADTWIRVAELQAQTAATWKRAAELQAQTRADLTAAGLTSWIPRDRD